MDVALAAAHDAPAVLTQDLEPRVDVVGMPDCRHDGERHAGEGRRHLGDYPDGQAGGASAQASSQIERQWSGWVAATRSSSVLFGGRRPSALPGGVLAFNRNGIPHRPGAAAGRRGGPQLRSTSIVLKPGANDLYIVTSDGEGEQGATVFHVKAFAQALPLYSHQ